MAKYIEKAALIAKITRLKVPFDCGWNCALDKVLEHIDDLEVKEIDGEPRTSAENNDQIAYGHIADNDKSK